MLSVRNAYTTTLTAAAALVLLQACDNGPSAVAKRPASEAQAAYAAPAASGDWNSRGDDARAQPVRRLDGKPLWSASRRYSAEDNAKRAFDRNGETFGARSVDEFARKAHAFVDRPPAGVLTLTRANGDTLFYDPKANIFAVANREGAPRTMFKPDDGMAYWEEQKTREAKRQTARSERSERSNRGDDG